MCNTQLKKWGLQIGVPVNGTLTRRDCDRMNPSWP